MAAPPSTTTPERPWSAPAPAGRRRALLPPALVLRQLAAADRSAVEAMAARCSRASLGDRFLAPVRSMPPAYLDRVCPPADGVAALAVVPAGQPGHVLAVGSGHPTGADVEIAVLVEDAWQRRGIAAALLTALADAARARGARCLTATFRRDRTWIPAALERTVGPVATRSESAVTEAWAALAPDPGAEARHPAPGAAGHSGCATAQVRSPAPF